MTGIYLPVGMLPAAMQTVVKLFPVSHAALLMRRVMMEAPMETVFAGVGGGAPALRRRRWRPFRSRPRLHISLADHLQMI